VLTFSSGVLGRTLWLVCGFGCAGVQHNAFQHIRTP
jgi:hypothetical protein